MQLHSPPLHRLCTKMCCCSYTCRKLSKYTFPIKTQWSAVYMTSHHVYSALEGLLNQILHCYIWEHSLRSDSCCFVYRVNTDLPRHQSRVPASTFSIVVILTLCDFVWPWTERSATTRCRVEGLLLVTGPLEHTFIRTIYQSLPSLVTTSALFSWHKIPFSPNQPTIA